MTLTAKEAAEYSNIGINKIDSLLRTPNCPFVLFVGTKKLVKRREFEQYICHNGDLKVSSLLRKESPCATIIKCAGASARGEKEVSEWVKATVR